MKREGIKLIHGGVFDDIRGQIKFVNDFDMSNVIRFYTIENIDTSVVRGWRGHRLEQRWFYVIAGEFVIDLIKIDDWTSASRNLNIERIRLKSADSQIVQVPEGHAVAFQAMKTNSRLLVFADSTFGKSEDDDYTWPLEYFLKREIIMTDDFDSSCV